MNCGASCGGGQDRPAPKTPEFRISAAAMLRISLLEIRYFEFSFFRTCPNPTRTRANLLPKMQGNY